VSRRRAVDPVDRGGAGIRGRYPGRELRAEDRRLSNASPTLAREVVAGSKRATGDPCARPSTGRSIRLVFSSITFVFFFLPVVVGIYLLLGPRLRNVFLLATSLLFYTWGGGTFVLWLLLSIAGNWGLGFVADRARESGTVRNRRAAVAASVVLNLSLLGWFKYANFLADQLHALGFSFLWSDVALPIGISFFTFQAMSYVIDVARGDADVLRDPLDFALYVALFPQLIAGPIVRFREIADQILRRTTSLADVTTGATRFALGLTKKVLVADSVAPIADAVFASDAPLSVGDAWVGMLAYGVQIYFDFSGYSDMAIGMGRMFGFRIPENFRRPYAAVSVTDFWRRWHITLSSWFRDYVYIPLGGSRVSAARGWRNLIAIFLLTGAWHGANWTFILWGVYHGALLIFERQVGWRTEPVELVPRLARRGYAFLAVMFGWVVFRAESLSDAAHVYGALVGLSSTEGATAIADVLTVDGTAALLFGLAAAFLPPLTSAGVYLDTSASTGAAAYRYAVAVVALPLALLTIASAGFSPFLYFRF